MTKAKTIKQLASKVAAPTYTAKQYQLFQLAAQAGLSDITDVEKLDAFAKLAVIHHVAENKSSPSPFVSREELIAAIKGATREKQICVPDTGYDRRTGDWSHDDIKFVDADDLIEILTNGPSN